MPSFITVSIASGVADAFVHGVDRFVDHRHQHAIRNESRKVAHFDRRLAHLRGEIARELDTSLATSRYRE